MVTKTETSFYVRTNQWEKAYYITDSENHLLAVVWRCISIIEKQMQNIVNIDYDLQYNVVRKFTASEKRMIKIYYDNLVSTLTRDIQTIFTDNIEDRMNLPFYVNLLHVKVVD